ncbi:MAG: cysteine hydrolase [bacterium]|nr:MAG: cysteine hydrolase [bacterium]
MKETPFGESTGNFLHWLSGWRASLAEMPAPEAFGKPDRTAVMSVDLIKGFCYEGPLASPRVAAIVPAVVTLFERAYGHGIERFVLFQDTHDEEAPEFDAFGPHCVAGSTESETIDELAALPFANLFTVMPKNSLSAAIGTGLDGWLASNADVDRFIVVGDCTDLCVYQLAMYLRLTANTTGMERSVIVPADCVDTYDMPVGRAAGLGALPHDGDLLHTLFLYHMALNGIEVVAGIAG